MEIRFSPLMARFWNENYSYAWPDIDISENPDSFVFAVEIPGALKDDIKIWIENDVLAVTGEKRGIPDKEGAKLVAERTFGKFERSFKLPRSVDRNKVTAELVDGVLVINIPKIVESKPKEILIG